MIATVLAVLAFLDATHYAILSRVAVATLTWIVGAITVVLVAAD
ncbi:hypothetical protein ACFQO4_07860 [Saliphagus sp. GCM10025334]